MNFGYGIESPGKHTHEAEQAPARYLVVISSSGVMVARMFLENREPVAEFDAGAEEVHSMTAALMPAKTAHLPEWDRALAGHSDAERRAAEVYTLEI